MDNTNLEIRLDFINNKLSITNSFRPVLEIANIKNINEIHQTVLTLITSNQLTLKNLDLNQSEVPCGN